jgi:hypothetical protein
VHSQYIKLTNISLQTSTVFERELPQILNSETRSLFAPAGIVFKNLNVAGNIVASHSSWEQYLADVVYKVTLLDYFLNFTTF